MSYLADMLRPEDLLLLSCARSELDGNATTELEQRLAVDLDWQYVLRHALRHGIEVLVRDHLSTYGSRIPKDVMEFLAARACQVTFRNRRQMDELTGCVALLENNGVPVIPFKGPLLAEMLYGNAGCRTFGDLDILLHRDNIPLAKQLLLDGGYESVRKLTGDQERRFLDTQMGYEFYHREKDIVVEFHWALLSGIYAFRLTPEEVWDRHVRVSASGGIMRSLAPEDLLIYLSAHGTRHRWSRIAWIADVAEFLRRNSALDWDLVCRKAERLRCVRMLWLGIHLAKELLDAPVPDALVREAASSRAVRSMARKACLHWIFQEPGDSVKGDLDAFFFHWKQRENVRDRLPFLGHHVRLWAKPSQRDRAFVDLPNAASFLYYFLRPVRVLVEGTSRMGNSETGAGNGD